MATPSKELKSAIRTFDSSSLKKSSDAGRKKKSTSSRKNPYRRIEKYDSGMGDWERVDADPEIALAELPTIKCVSYNIWFVDAFFSERREALCKLLEESDAQVICLQEVTERFLEYLVALPWVQEKYKISDSHGHTVNPYGVLLLTTLPVKRVALHPLTSRMGRKLLVIELALSDCSMAISTVHLESMETKTQERIQQLTYIMEELLSEYDHAMVMGDFNFHEVSTENATCVETHTDYVDMWPALYPGEDGHTVTETRTRFAGWRIDRMLLRSSRYSPKSLERIGREPILNDEFDLPIFPSDHFGLCGVVSLTEGGATPCESVDAEEAIGE